MEPSVTIDLICIVCESSASEWLNICPVTLGGETIYRLVECPSCETRQVFPMPTPDELDQFYNTGYYGSDWYKQRGWGRTFAQRHLPKRDAAKFLEVGCGLGYFLDGIRSASEWKVCGTEFGSDNVEHAQKELGLDVRRGELPDIGFDAAEFDYIRICNVLEHVRDPMSVLHECRRIIKSDGTLEIAIPNGPIDSRPLEDFFASERTAPVSKDGHIFFFSQKALEIMFEKSGFRMTKAGSFGIRRGLRILGKYPHRTDWKRPYFTSNRNYDIPSTITIPPEKKRLPGYYHFRRMAFEWREFPGMRPYSLNFMIILAPKA